MGIITIYRLGILLCALLVFTLTPSYVSAKTTEQLLLELVQNPEYAELYKHYWEPAFSEQTPKNTQEECTAFYDLKRSLLDEQLSKVNYRQIVRELENEGRKQEAYFIAFSPLLPLIELANNAEQCAVLDERYYRTYEELCFITILDPRFDELFNLFKGNIELIKTERDYCSYPFSPPVQ